MHDAEVKFKVTIDDSKASNSINKLNKKVQTMGNVGKGLTKAITLPTVAIGAFALNAAANLEATEAKFNTVFGNMADDVDLYIEEFQKLTPATKAEARSMASGIQDLLVPMGFVREEATALTKETLHLVGALTNFNSATHTTEEVTNAFQSALTGEFQSLKQLGIQTSKTEVQQKALAMTGKENVKELTAQEEALALLEIAYEQSGDALAAYNEESLDTKTKSKILRKEFEDLAAELGKELLPVANDVVGVLSGMLKWFKELDPATQENIIRFTLLAAALGPVLTLVSKVITILPAMKALFIALSSPVALTAAAIGLVAANIKMFSDNWDGIKNVLSSFSFDNWKKGWDKLVDSTGQFLKNLLGVPGAMSALDKAILGSAAASVEGLGGGFSAITGKKVGGGGGGAGGFANGGNTPINKPFWVGERGPELMQLRTSANVIPNNKAMNMNSNSGQVTIINQIAGEEVSRVIVPDITRLIKNGGIR